jgi:hypothetical protein
MQYVVSWRERPTGPVAEYGAAQERLIDVFAGREVPEGLTVRKSVVWLGDLGGYAVVETDEPADLQHLASVFPPFSFTVAPVADVAVESRDPQKALLST